MEDQLLVRPDHLIGRLDKFLEMCRWFICFFAFYVGTQFIRNCLDIGKKD